MNARILVLVIKDTNARTSLVVIAVKISTNVQQRNINAIVMLTVLILLGVITVFVTLVMKVMVDDALT